jgi:hypothetical protein
MSTRTELSALKKILLTSFVLGKLRRDSYRHEKEPLESGDRGRLYHLPFYSNLLMGEFERSGWGQKKGVVWAIADVFTAANFEIAAVAALVGYVLFEFLRKRF